MDLHEHGKIWAESEGEGKGCTFFVQLPVHLHAYEASQRGSVLNLTRPPTIQNLLAEVKQSESRKGGLIDSAQDLMSQVQETWKPTILVVDDSAMNRKMLVRMLISNGFACREAEDGVVALSEMSRFHMRKSISGVGVGRRMSADDRRGSWGMHKKSIAESFGMHNQQFSIDAVLIDFHMPRMNGPDTIVEMRKIGYHGLIIGVSGGDEKSMQQFLQAGADNVIQKPASSHKLMDMLLTGFRLVVHEETSRKPAAMDNVRGTEDATPQERITRLCKFLREKEAAKN